MTRTLILCLGNEIISDDRFGYEVAEELSSKLLLRDDVEVEFAARAGLYLLDRLTAFDRVLIVDSTVTNTDPPGTLRLHSAGEFTPSKNLTSSHQISLPTALELAKRLGIDMPQRIDVLTCEAQDIETLATHMTSPVAAAVSPATESVINWLSLEEEYAYT